MWDLHFFQTGSSSPALLLAQSSSSPNPTLSHLHEAQSPFQLVFFRSATSSWCIFILLHCKCCIHFKLLFQFPTPEEMLTIITFAQTATPALRSYIFSPSSSSFSKACPFLGPKSTASREDLLLILQMCFFLHQNPPSSRVSLSRRPTFHSDHYSVGFSSTLPRSSATAELLHSISPVCFKRSFASLVSAQRLLWTAVISH